MEIRYMYIISIILLEVKILLVKYCISRNFREVVIFTIKSQMHKIKTCEKILPLFIGGKFVRPMIGISYSVLSVHTKLMNLEVLVRRGNGDLNMVKTNITAIIFKASHIIGEYSFIRWCNIFLTCKLEETGLHSISNALSMLENVPMINVATMVS